MGVAAISVDSPEDSQQLRERLSLEFPLLTDATLATIRAYGLEHVGKDMSIPATFVIDQAGVVRYRYAGEHPADRPALAAVLAALETASTPPDGPQTDPAADAD